MVTDVAPALALTILNVVPLRIALATEELGAEIMEYGGVPPDKVTNTVSCCVANRESIEAAIAVGAGASGASALFADFDATGIINYYTADSGATVAAGTTVACTGGSDPYPPGIGKTSTYWYLPAGSYVYRSTTVTGFASIGSGAAASKFVTGV
jgi:hypothetical protein